MQSCPNHPSELEVRECARCSRSFCTSCLLLLRGLYSCGECKERHVRDLQAGVVPGELELASFLRRFRAQFIDGFLQMIVIYSIMGLMIGVMMLAMDLRNPERSAGDAFIMVWIISMYGVMFLVPVLYETLFLIWKGQTPGKMAMGVRVVTPDGARISNGQAWGRALLRLVLSCAAIIDYIPALFDKEKRTIHDMAARTRVVRIQG
jgi:uncharacterized RDD family membrane protein YckC